MKAYKGFNKDITCRGFQFKEGETYVEDKAKLCEAGFHACEAPIDCLNYYAPSDSVYHEVELYEVSDERRDDSKIVGKIIKIGAEIGVPGLVKAQVEYIKNLISPTTAGEEAHATTAGEEAHAEVHGVESIAAAFGRNSVAKAVVGSWIVLAEYDDEHLLLVKAEYVDGEKIKADTWYTLKAGELVEVEEKS